MRRMEDRYRLVYRGEVLEGQHPAVVKKRLGALLKVDGERLDALMAGEPVVVRREADKATAAKFQSAFKQAGARLRVAPIVAGMGAPKPSALETEGESHGAPVAPAASAPVTAATAPGLSLRPRAGELLDAAERPVKPAVVIDTNHLSVAPVGPLPQSERLHAAMTPDLSHLTLAAPGTTLSDAKPVDAPALHDVSHLTVAPPHATLSESDAVVPAIDVDGVHFDVAPAGADLGQKPAPPAPPPPDTSHLRLK